MLFSPAFCTVSTAISLSVFALSAVGWLCFPYACVLLCAAPQSNPQRVPPPAAPAWTVWQRWKMEAGLSKTDSIPMTTTDRAVWWARDSEPKCVRVGRAACWRGLCIHAGIKRSLMIYTRHQHIYLDSWGAIFSGGGRKRGGRRVFLSDASVLTSEG